MELTIAHLAPYLPYGLKVRTKYHGGKINNPITLTSNTLTSWLRCDGRMTITPIFRPLSALTQEIEHNGERFVPMKKLVYEIEPKYITICNRSFDFNTINKSLEKDRVFQIRYKTDEDDYKEVSMLNFHEVEMCLWHTSRIVPMSCYQKLFEWHFDVFGLEQGLAVNKLTLNR